MIATPCTRPAYTGTSAPLIFPPFEVIGITTTMPVALFEVCDERIKP